MKCFILYVFALLGSIIALMLLVDRVNVYLICASSGNSAYKMKRLYENPEPDEIAIVGSSRALGNYVPSIISFRCFNYGENGMGFGEILPILRVLRERRTAAPVILNLDPWGVCRGTDVADYRLAPQSGKVSGWDRVWGVRFFGKLRQNLVAYLDAQRSVTRVIDRGAQLLKNNWAKEAWIAINAKIGKVDCLSDLEGVSELIDVLRGFAPRKVYVVICPCSSHWTEMFQGRTNLAALIRALQSIPNVTVLNYFGSMRFSDDDFVDPTHLNIVGARKFSSMLKVEK